MRPIEPIPSDVELADYAELQRVIRFVDPSEIRRKFNWNFAATFVGSCIFGAACWTGVAYLVIWFCLNGPRIFNHWIDAFMVWMGAK